MNPQRNPSTPSPIDSWIDSSETFFDEFLALCRQAVLAEPMSFCLRGLEQYWKFSNNAPALNGESYRRLCWKQLEDSFQRFATSTSAQRLRQELLGRVKLVTSGGPTGMELTVQNEFVYKCLNVLDALGQKAYEQACQATPEDTLLPLGTRVVHRPTQELGTVMSTALFTSKGFVYTVFQSSLLMLKHWPASDVEILS